MRYLLPVMTGFLLVFSVPALPTGPTCAGMLTGTSAYVFGWDIGWVHQTGGSADISRTCFIIGSFGLSVDPNAGTARFTCVDANLVDLTDGTFAGDLDEVFNLTALVGVVVDDRSLQFTGTTGDGSAATVTLTCRSKGVEITGAVVPPTGSVDSCQYSLYARLPRKYASGTGEPNDPYLIYTAEHLNSMDLHVKDCSKHFKLMADIDLGQYQNTAFNTINVFSGVFDGNAHTITNFSYTATREDDGGLFKIVAGPGARIQDLRLVDGQLDARGWRAGLLVGHLREGVLSNCHAVGAAVRGGVYVGGLVGENGYEEPFPGHIRTVGTVRDCSYQGSVCGGPSVGGLVGMNRAGVIAGCWADCDAASIGDNVLEVGGLVGCCDGGTISACYTTGTVSGKERLGGLIGDFLMGTVRNCYSAVGVTGDRYVGGLIGANFAGSVKTSFWDMQASGQATSAGGLGKLTAEMQTAETFLAAGWDFVDEATNGTDDIWWIEEGEDYPRLVWERVGVNRPAIGADPQAP